MLAACSGDSEDALYQKELAAATEEARGKLAWFWEQRGQFSEGRRMTESALALEDRPTAARARALSGAAVLAAAVGVVALGACARAPLLLPQQPRELHKLECAGELAATVLEIDCLRDACFGLQKFRTAARRGRQERDRALGCGGGDPRTAPCLRGAGGPHEAAAGIRDPAGAFRQAAAC